MLTKNSVVHLFLSPCTGTPWRDVLQIIIVFELLYAFGFIFHGSYLCSTESKDTWYGIIYLCLGWCYWTLAWLLWILIEKPTKYRCHLWLGISVFVLLTTIVVTITRNAAQNRFVFSANIWILGGLFLQSYLIWVVWAYKKHTEENKMCQDDNGDADVRQRVVTTTIKEPISSKRDYDATDVRQRVEIISIVEPITSDHAHDALTPENVDVSTNKVKSLEEEV